MTLSPGPYEDLLGSTAVLRITTSVKPKLHQWLIGAIAYIASWCLVVFGFGAQLAGASAMNWDQAWRFTARDWLPWVFLSPIIFLLVRWLPLDRQTLATTIPTYMLAGILSVGMAGICSEWLATTSLFEVNLLEIERERERERELERDRQRPFNPDRPPRFRDGSPGPRLGPPGSRSGRRGIIPPIWVRARFHAPVFLMALSLANAIVHYRLSQERGKKASELTASLAEAKLQALRLQLQPHFLFNSLNAIATLVHKDPARADDMIASLSDLLRATLEIKEQQIPLRRELQLLDLYLDMEQMRLGERLIVENAIRPDTLDLMVPTMLLQPIAENAVRHGIEPRLAPGKLRIETLRLNNRLVISIEDNGVGMKSAGQTSSREGIGLANSKARLKELYGERAGISVVSSESEGTKVQIEIPIPG